MILQALANCYERLVEKGTLEPPGWQPVGVSFGLRLNDEGELLQVIPLKTPQKKKKKEEMAPQSLNVPAQVKRTVGIAGNFLCDNATYMLGIDKKGKPRRSKECFEACKQLHHALLDGCADPMAQAILRFFDAWQPEKALEHPALTPYLEDILAGGNLIFMQGMTYAQEAPALKEAWNRSYADTSGSVEMQCLITGEMGPVAALHPSIKGVAGAQPTGASIVSFNAPAFESYGHDGGQGANAPVSQRAAFAYGAALNWLISQQNHMRRFGDTTVVYWSEDGEEAYAQCFTLELEGGETVSDEELKDIMGKLAQGLDADWAGIPLHSGNRFYVLGLAPNASRLSVRFFLQDSFGAFAAHMRQHHERLQIVRPAFDHRELLPLWQLMGETVNQKSRDKTPLPQLAGDMLRAVLSGGRYPATLMNQTQLRIRAEREMTRGRAAIVKAYLLRNADDRYKEVVQTVELNENTTYTPYVLGRLFAVLEGLQQDANPGINTTIKDRYFSSACATPAIVFPQLVKLAQAHLKKLSVGNQIYYNKQITALEGLLVETYPKRLNLYDQGTFQIGYYHQTQKRFTKKEDK